MRDGRVAIEYCAAIGLTDSFHICLSLSLLARKLFINWYRRIVRFWSKLCVVHVSNCPACIVRPCIYFRLTFCLRNCYRGRRSHSPFCCRPGSRTNYLICWLNDWHSRLVCLVWLGLWLGFVRLLMNESKQSPFVVVVIVITIIIITVVQLIYSFFPLPFALFLIPSMSSTDGCSIETMRSISLIWSMGSSSSFVWLRYVVSYYVVSCVFPLNAFAFWFCGFDTSTQSQPNQRQNCVETAQTKSNWPNWLVWSPLWNFHKNIAQNVRRQTRPFPQQVHGHLGTRIGWAKNVNDTTLWRVLRACARVWE